MAFDDVVLTLFSSSFTPSFPTRFQSAWKPRSFRHWRDRLAGDLLGAPLAANECLDGRPRGGLPRACERPLRPRGEGLTTRTGPHRVLARQHVEKLLATCVAAACDQCDALGSELLAQAKRGCERCRPRRFDQVARCLDHHRLRDTDLLVANEHEVVEPLPEDSLRELECRACGKALGECPHPALDQPPLLPGTECRRRGLRLDADHPDGRV